ncbi:PhzF family phenazine biosynthesis protein [Bacillus infantis]|uniref:PhzF family phenazine biosynthesis protein n=1 Tax=Bacillus infantis TaxID=324767 RepID=A0A5D4SQN8_9BACI|nr:PhzF family phenazine biosynthesis protein [Bacillus infantis]TYS64126.1 PhzF family phenazine biosynthesis protein [Bacillus infantis]
MKNITFYQVDAFTDQAFGGNPAGVVPEAEILEEEEMQLAAREFNLSETAFLSPSGSENADFRVRYFTPSCEIDFCGHATLSAAWIMASELDWLRHSREIRFETNIGIVPVIFQTEGEKLVSAEMTQISPKIKEIEYSLEELCQMIGVSSADIDDRYPIRLGYTGNWHLLVPLKTREAIDGAAPQFDLVEEHNRRLGISTTHLFTFDAKGMEYDIYTRDFAPAAGIREDPVTGSANGALAGYLMLENILEQGRNHMLAIGQGHAAGRPGLLQAGISSDGESIRITIGGSAVPVISGTLAF